MRGSLRFRVCPADSAPYSDSLSLRLSGPQAHSLAISGDGNSQVHYAKSTPSPHHVAPTACRRMVSGSICSSVRGCFSPFPSRYSFAIGLSVVFSLSGWSPIFQLEFLVFRHTRVASRLSSAFAYGALTRCGPTFQTVPPASRTHFARRLLCPPAHALRHRRFWAPPVRSPLLGNRCYFLFLRVLRCFQFPAFAFALSAQCRDRSRQVAHSDIPGSRCICHSPPRLRSRLVTSFFASESLGRHPHAPFFVPFYLHCGFNRNFYKRGLKSDFCSPFGLLVLVKLVVFLLFAICIRFKPHTSASSLVNVLF